MTDREQLQKATANGLLDRKIVIETGADFTPPGKRTARVVKTRGTMGMGRQLRWYVSGRLYRHLSPNRANLELTRRWIDAGA